MTHNFTPITALKTRLDALRPLPPAIAARLRENLLIEWTYHSNAIEGNTLTMQETRVVLEGITVGGKRLIEHFEAINHRDAILYVEDLVQQSQPLSEWQIRSIHSLVLNNIDKQNAGRYRSGNVMIAGARHIPPDALHVPLLMQQFVRWVENDSPALHPVERAALVHADFVGIHPFIDGNGRTSRLLMNLELMKAGYPPVVLPVTERLAYYQALDLAQCDGDYAPFIRLILRFAEAAFAPYWAAVG